MDRLTIITPKGAALKMADTYPDEFSVRADLMNRYRAAIDRLAAYEDTGLMPDEIMELCSMHERAKMAELLRNEENKPLTIDELREMDGELAWVEFSKCPEASGWMLVDVNRHCVYNGLLGNCDFESCGKTWLAYRRKPEEGTT